MPNENKLTSGRSAYRQGGRVIGFDDIDDPVCISVETERDVRNICTSRYCILDEISVSGKRDVYMDGTSFHVLFSAEGDFDIIYTHGKVEAVKMGTSVLVPAALDAYSIKAKGTTTVLKTALPV
jgi:mannose-6-phosphate isomerase class I